MSFQWANCSANTNVTGTTTTIGSADPAGANGAIAAGDFLLAALMLAGSTDPGAPSVAGFTTLYTVFQSGGFGRYWVGYKIAGASESGTYAATWASSSAGATWALADYGAATLDTSGGKSNASYSTGVPLPSITATGASETLVGVFMNAGAENPYTLPAAMTARSSIATTTSGVPWIGIADVALSSSGATPVYSATMAYSSYSASVAIALAGSAPAPIAVAVAETAVASAAQAAIARGAVGEIGAAADAVGAGTRVALPEAAAAADSVRAGASVAIGETATPADTVAGAARFVLGIAEAVAATDAVAAVGSGAYAVALAESAAAADVAAVAASGAASRAEVAGAADTIATAASAPASVAEVAGVTDAIVAIASAPASVAEIAGASDGIAGAARFAAGVAESVGASDAVAASTGGLYLLGIAETAPASDALDTAARAAAAVREGVATLDAVAAAAGAGVSVAERAPAADVGAALASYAILDAVAAADATALGGAFAVALADLAAASDIVYVPPSVPPAQPWSWAPSAARTLALWPAPPLRWPDKATDAVLDFTLDATGLPASPSDTLSATASCATLAVEAVVVRGALVTLWLGGGAAARDNAIDLRLATASGRAARRLVRLLTRAPVPLAAVAQPALPLPTGAPVVPGTTLPAGVAWSWAPSTARTLLLWPADGRLRWPDKAAAEMLDYTLDASALQETGADTLTASLVAGPLNVEAAVVRGGLLTVWLGGGVAGTDYPLDVRLATASGRAARRVVRLLVE